MIHPIKSKNIFIIWNKNKSNEIFNENGIQVVHNYPEVEKIKKGAAIIFILLELNWSGQGSYNSLLGIKIWQELIQRKELSGTIIFPISIFNAKRLKEIRPEYTPIIDGFSRQLITPNKIFNNLEKQGFFDAITSKIHKNKKQKALGVVKSIYYDINQDVSCEHRSLASNLIKYALDVDSGNDIFALELMKKDISDRLSILIDNLKELEPEVKKNDKELHQKIFTNNFNLINLSESILKTKRSKNLRRHILFFTYKLNSDYFQPDSFVNQSIVQFQLR